MACASRPGYGAVHSVRTCDPAATRGRHRLTGADGVRAIGTGEGCQAASDAEAHRTQLVLASSEIMSVDHGGENTKFTSTCSTPGSG
jgi:hypothetical protein